MTSSLVEKWGNIDFSDMQLHNNYDPEKAYYRSKLALLIYSYNVSKRFTPNKLTCNTFEPGLTKTDFSRDFKGIMKYGSKLMKLFMHSPEVPAKTATYLAINDDLANITGTNYYNMKVKKTSDRSNDESLSDKLMAYTRKELQYYLDLNIN